MSPALTLTSTLWAATVLVAALAFALAVIARDPHMIAAVFAVLTVGAFATTPHPTHA